MEYIVHILIMIGIYTMLTLAANLPVGMAKLLSLCQAAFYGLGAYFGAFFLMHCNYSLALIALAVMLLTGLLSLVVSYASIKLKGDYFVLATLGFQLIVYTVLYNWIDVTRGPYGVVGIPPVRLFGLVEVGGEWAMLGLTALFTALSILLFLRLGRSPYGRALRAIQTDETSVQTLGRNTTRYKSWAFFISAGVSALAGMLYAAYISYIDPTSFTLNESIFILTALFIGGTGNVRGPVLGAAFVVLLPELLRLIGLPDAVAANLRQIIYGLALILIMYYRPQGLIGKKHPNA